MSVIPCSLFQDRQYLTQVLLASQQKSRDTGYEHFVSISQKIAPLDPLLALELFGTPKQHYFYLENPTKNQAIACFGAVAIDNNNSKNRFQKSQDFIQYCQKNTTSLGDLHLSGSGIYFCCGFSFFSYPQKKSYPFAASNIFLPQWQISRQLEHSILVANLAINHRSDIDKLVTNLLQKFKQIVNISSHCYFSLKENSLQRIHQKLKQEISYDNHKFKSAVTSALESIAHHEFQKIVLAQVRDLVSAHPFSVVSALDHLRGRYPDCYTFAFSNGTGATFIGASPERLVSIKNQYLVTDALAGSAPRSRDLYLDQKLGHSLLHNQKERNEHQTVVDFLDRALRELGLNPQKLTTPNLLQLSNIQHLWTPISAKLDHDLHPLEILAKLHPTPAVAGTPREIVSEEISRYEEFDRGLYAAPLGWIDQEGNSEFIVAIRSCLIEGCHAKLYAGAGIVAGSDPDRELAEIDLKFQPLLQALTC